MASTGVGKTGAEHRRATAVPSISLADLASAMDGSAGGAQPARFDDLPGDGEAAIRAEPAQRFDDCVVLDFLGRAAIVADHELALMRMLDIVAGDERADALDLVNELVREQKVERAIDGRWAELAPFALEGSQQRIGADRVLRGENEFEDPPPYRRQPRAAHCTKSLRPRQRPLDVLRSHDSYSRASLGDGRQFQCYSAARDGSNKRLVDSPPASL